MKLSLLSLAITLPLGLAKAPIKNAEYPDVVADSYIVIYKQGVSAASKKKHEDKVDATAKGVVSISSTNATATSGRRGGGWAAKNGISSKFGIGRVSGYQLQIAAADLDAVLDDPLVDYVEKDAVISLNAPVIETPAAVEGELAGRDLESLAFVNQTNAPWGLARIAHRKKGATSFVYGASAGNGASVYVIDTGIYVGHSVSLPESFQPKVGY
jgi:hypothetical protein